MYVIWHTYCQNSSLLLHLIHQGHFLQLLYISQHLQRSHFSEKVSSQWCTHFLLLKQPAINSNRMCCGFVCIFLIYLLTRHAINSYNYFYITWNFPPSCTLTPSWYQVICGLGSATMAQWKIRVVPSGPCLMVGLVENVGAIPSTCGNDGASIAVKI